MNGRRAVWVTAALLVLAVAAGWALDAWASRGTGDASSGVYRIAVVRDGRTLRSFSLADLREVGTRRVYMQDQWEEGPPLAAVLKAAGVSSFERVTVVGLGVRDAGRLDLERTGIDERVLLDIAFRGTAKVCGPGIPFGKRVRDVTRLIVE